MPTWIYQNLSENDTESQPFGYWTAHGGFHTGHSKEYGWIVPYSGEMGTYTVVSSSSGIRPIIAVLKSSIV